MKKLTDDEKFSRGFERLMKKYRIARDHVATIAAKNQDLFYYTEDGMKMMILGVIKLAMQFKEKGGKLCSKKKVERKK